MTTFKIAALTCALTLFAVFLTFNFMPSEKKIQRQLERSYALNEPQFLRSMGVLLGPPILEGNKVEVLLNGDQIFPSMLAAIRSAEHTITFETYIYWSETIGEEFSAALIERARAGVKVHVMLDFIGSIKMEDKLMKQMTDAGIELERFHKPVWWKLTKLNNRTHRKVLVIDGKVGFTGGVGIADQWRGQGQDKKHWRDTHFRVEGPAVGQMQAVFVDNWTKATGRVLDGARYFPLLEARGEHDAQMFSSSPSGGSESMLLMYLMSITAAKDTIELSASYFVPDELAIKALIDASKRGVKIRIITPGEDIDSKIVRAASRALWGELLKAGIQIAEYQPTMYHVKAMVVDSLMVSVGSTNFDQRSFSINDEANLNVIDAAFARQQVAIFNDDWKRARVVTYAEWENRPLMEKAYSKLASFASEQL